MTQPDTPEPMRWPPINQDSRLSVWVRPAHQNYETTAHAGWINNRVLFDRLRVRRQPPGCQPAHARCGDLGRAGCHLRGDHQRRHSTVIVSVVVQRHQHCPHDGDQFSGCQLPGAHQYGYVTNHVSVVSRLRRAVCDQSGVTVLRPTILHPMSSSFPARFPRFSFCLVPRRPLGLAFTFSL